MLDKTVKLLPNGVEVRQGQFYSAAVRRPDGTEYRVAVSDHDGLMFSPEINADSFHSLYSANDTLGDIAPFEGWAARLVGMSNWVALDADPVKAVEGAVAYREAHQPSEEVWAECFPELFGGER